MTPLRALRALAGLFALTSVSTAPHVGLAQTLPEPRIVARESEPRYAVVSTEIDPDLLYGHPRARAYDARRRKYAISGAIQGAFVLALSPLAIRNLRQEHDPAVRAIAGSWLALGHGIVTFSAVMGGHASIAESRYYVCDDRRTSRRNGRAALALSALPVVNLLSPLFAYRQHQVTEAARICELEAAVRARRIRILEAQEDESGE